MHESFLHYVWQFQYFRRKDLQTINGEKIEVFSPGTLNLNAGPDFLNARIRIGDVDWAGNVEIHTKASAWLDHHHDVDVAYDNVILHVVWQNDKPVFRADKTPMPTLELQALIEENLVYEYKKLVNNPSSIPCAKSLPNVPAITRLSMLDRALMQRVEARADLVLQLLRQNQNDWEETAYQLMGRNFGFKINSEPFLQLVQGVPRKLLLKHADNLLQIESLLFGQAGYLENPGREEHAQLLQREYNLLAKKYDLTNTQLNGSVWKFMRLRPANFPTLRIAQFSALVHHRHNLFSCFLEAETARDLFLLLDVSPSDYWHGHYRFGRKTTRSLAGMGADSIGNIIMNTIVPLLVAYGKYKDEQRFVDRAIHHLQALPGESNRIVSQWKELGIEARTAFDSQALIELNNHFCLKRKCLSCHIGSHLLRPRTLS